MALAKKCDRCGQLYEHYLLGNQSGVFNSIAICRRNATGTMECTKTALDLCPNCMALLEKFITEGKTT